MIKPLIDYLSKDISISFLRNITWVMVNLCRHKETPVSFDAVREILPALKCLLSHSDTTVCSVLDATRVPQQFFSRLDSGRLYVGPCLSARVRPSHYPAGRGIRDDSVDGEASESHGHKNSDCWSENGISLRVQSILDILALRAVGNVATGSDEQTQVVLNHGALHSLLKLINHQKEKVTKVRVM